MLACLDMTGGLESALRGTDSTLREIAQRHWRSIQAHRPCVLRAPSRATDLHVGYRTAYSDGHLESDLVSVWHFIIHTRSPVTLSFTRSPHGNRARRVYI